MRDLHDSSFELWFDHPRMVQDLLRGFLPADLAVVFDFDTLEQMSAQYVGDDPRQSRGDMLWRVRFHTEAGREWLYLLVLLEFQSTVDRHMAARVLAYTARAHAVVGAGGGRRDDRGGGERPRAVSASATVSAD